MPAKFRVLLGLLLVLVARPSAADPADDRARSRWTDAYPNVVADVQAGLPLTILVVVPLCDSRLIHCGGQGAGDPGSLERNLYWGRGFGVRRFFDERPKIWERVERREGAGAVLEQVTYRRWVPGKPWGDGEAAAPERVEQLVVLRAVHGARIDEAVLDLYRFAQSGAEATFADAGRERHERVHAVGYAGHNRLMDVSLAPPEGGRGNPVPSFVFACRSAPYFSGTLSELGSQPLVMTRDLMAPEGYIIDALTRGLGERLTQGELRRRVVQSYARWQRLPEHVAGQIFAR